MADIELNEQFKKALDVLENTSKNVFITGKAGTGKSTLLTYFRERTLKKLVVLAPTGVAALNVKGETIHSFFNFKPGISRDAVKKIKGKKRDVYKALDAIIIDEVSMVRADLLDCIDAFLRLNGPKLKKPFGGVQMIFIGDLYQLPPVVSGQERDIFKTHYKSPYFFSAHVFDEIVLEFIELEKIYRQKDEIFISLLNAIRNNTIGDEGLRLLNLRLGAKLPENKGNDFSLHLTTTNAAASSVNDEHLSRLKNKSKVYSADIVGEFSQKDYPTECDLRLAIGAQIMMLNNDQQGRWVNGSIGRIKEIQSCKETGLDVIKVELSGGKTVDVGQFVWEIFHFSWDEETEAIVTEEAGSFCQYPIRLAWAITIHKSQGKTFDRLVIDMGNGAFAGGQTYVALSRCRSLEGISLKVPIKKSHVFSDWRIVQFMTKHQYKLSERDLPLDKKIAIIEQAISEGGELEITYLKADDQKSRRIIIPREVGEMFYSDKPFLGVNAYCLKRKEDRVFRVDRILEMKPV